MKLKRILKMFIGFDVVPDARIFNTRFLVLLFLWVYLFSPGICWADRILFAPRNTLSGTLEKLSGGKITFSVAGSSEIKIPVEKVLKVYTKKNVVVVLNNGARLVGNLVPTGGKGKLGIHLAKAKRRKQPVVLLWKDVQAINPPDREWKGNISIGGSSQTGNTERTNFSIAGKGELALKQDVFSLSFLHNFAEENDRVTARNTYGAFKFEHYFNSAWYWLLSAELLNDKFKDLNLRAIIGPGVGYTVWNDAVKSLKLEGGISYFSEDLRTGVDERWFTARAASNFSYNLMDWLQFTHQVLVYPSVEDLEDFKLRNEIGVVATVHDGFSVKISNILEHNSMPPVGVKKDDTTWLYSIQYDF
ncbi:MAG: DUF481 domain-containing protein [Nitrospina sp.]|nr:DUF481 domain-containing protein [Nitrospina sp.]